MDSAHQGAHACELENIIDKSVPTLDLNKNLHLTLKL